MTHKRHSVLESTSKVSEREREIERVLPWYKSHDLNSGLKSVIQVMNHATYDLNNGQIVHFLFGIQVIAWITDHWVNRLFVRYSGHALNKRPFDDRTCLDHLNTGLVRYSDPHCSRFSIRSLLTMETFSKVFTCGTQVLCFQKQLRFWGAPTTPKMHFEVFRQAWFT